MTLHFIFIPETLVSSFHPSTFSVFRAITYLEEIHVSHLNFDVTTQNDLSLSAYNQEKQTVSLGSVTP